MIKIIGLKIKYKGKNYVITQKILGKLFGGLHKTKINSMNYTPGLLHNIKYVKLYNSCYFIPNDASFNTEELKAKIIQSVQEYCFDLSVVDFELPEDEYFTKYVFKNGYTYWKDFTIDTGRIFRCKAKDKLEQ